MLNSEDIRSKLDIIANELCAIRKGTDASDTLRMGLLAEVYAKLELYENTLEDEVVATPHTTRKVVEESDDESYTPKMKKERPAQAALATPMLLNETELLSPTTALRGAIAVHEERRPHNTPVSEALDSQEIRAEQALDFDIEDVSSAMVANTLFEETENLEEDMKTIWWSLLGQHPKKMSLPLQKLLKHRLNLRPDSGLEIKTTATSKENNFNLNQIRLTSTAHLYFCFDIHNERLYPFFLWDNEMRNIARSYLNYQHNPTRAGKIVQEVSEDTVYHMQLNPSGLASKGKFAWNYLMQNHLKTMEELPAFLVEHGFCLRPE